MWNTIKTNIKGNLLSGLVLIVPVIITILVLRAIFRFFDNLLYPVINRYLEINIPGLGIIIGLILIYFVGLITKNYIGHKIVNWGEGVLGRIPVAKSVYTAVKQILVTFSGQQRASFKKVLLLEYPRKGVYSLGFLNGVIEKGPNGTPILSVLVMTSINPTSGYLVLLPPEEVIVTGLTTEQALKMIVSGGIVLPEGIPLEQNIDLTELKSED